MAKEFWCNDCGTSLGDPIQSNKDSHISTTGHKDIIEREKLLDDGTLASNPGTKPETEQAEQAETQEIKELKKTVPTKTEQKEIETLAEKKTKKSKYY